MAGIFDPGLMASGLRIQRRSILGRIVSRTSGDGVPAHQMSQVWAETSFRWSPRDSVAVDARRRFKHAFAGGLRGRSGQLLLLVNPPLEFLARLHIDADEHFRVLCPAILGALAQEDPV